MCRPLQALEVAITSDRTWNTRRRFPRTTTSSMSLAGERRRGVRREGAPAKVHHPRLGLWSRSGQKWQRLTKRRTKKRRRKGTCPSTIYGTRMAIIKTLHRPMREESPVPTRTPHLHRHRSQRHAQDPLRIFFGPDPDPAAHPVLDTDRVVVVGNADTPHHRVRLGHRPRPHRVAKGDAVK